MWSVLPNDLNLQRQRQDVEKNEWKKNLKINYKFAEKPSIPMDNLKSWGRNGFYIVYRGRGKKMAPTSTNG